jgi:hypothetical protein
LNEDEGKSDRITWSLIEGMADLHASA